MAEETRNSHGEFFIANRKELTDKLAQEGVALVDQVYEGPYIGSTLFGSSENVPLVRLGKTQGGRVISKFSVYPGGRKEHGLGRTDYAVLLPINADNVRFALADKHVDYFILGDIVENSDGMITQIDGKIVHQRGSIKDITEDME